MSITHRCLIAPGISIPPESSRDAELQIDTPTRTRQAIIEPARYAEGKFMNKRTGPAAAARRILEAFQTRKVGAEVTLDHIQGRFGRRGMRPSTEMHAGLEYALQVDWMRSVGLNMFALTGSGIETLDETRISPANPVAAWHIWLQE